MICGRNAAGRRRWNGPTESAHRVTLCPVPIRSTARATPAQIRSAGTRTPSGPPISSPKRTNRARISSPRSPPERPPNRPPAAPDSITPPEAVKKSGSKNPRHVTIVSMACHYCLACHYCTETERHTACHYCGGIYAHMSETARNASCHLCAEPRRHKKQATCGASYKRSVQ